MNRALLAASLFLAACGSPDAKVIDSSSQGVTVRYDGSDDGLNEANQKAKLSCAEHSRASAMIGTSRTDDSHIATYECRKAD